MWKGGKGGIKRPQRGDEPYIYKGNPKTLGKTTIETSKKVRHRWM
jgi:hypothetical protein